MADDHQRFVERNRLELDYLRERLTEAEAERAAFEARIGRKLSAESAEQATRKTVAALEARGYSALAQQLVQARAELEQSFDALKAEFETHGDLASRIARGASATELERAFALSERGVTAIDELDRVTDTIAQALDGPQRRSNG